MANGDTEVSAKRYRYTGKERDEETSLYYHGARYYAPWLGRWTAADPAGLIDGNLFTYGREDPIGLLDSNGNETTAREEESGMSLPEEHLQEPIGTSSSGGTMMSDGSVATSSRSPEPATATRASRPAEGHAASTFGAGGASGEDPYNQGQEGADPGCSPESLPQAVSEEAPATPGTYTVTIGIEASGGKKTYSGGFHSPGAGDYGHTYIWARDPNGIVSAFSFEPAQQMGVRQALDPANASVPGRTDWPLKDESAVEYTFQVGESQFKAGVKQIEERKANPGQFTMRRNCTTTAVDIANQGFDIAIPNGQTTLKLGPWSYQNVPSPYRLNEQFQESGRPPTTIEGAELQLRRDWIAGVAGRP